MSKTQGFIFKVVWILLKEKMSSLDIDMYGNTAVHQAAAAGQLKVLECFLSRGVDVDVKNASFDKQNFQFVNKTFSLTKQNF
jgi:ankyrin repeat protein